MKRKMSILALMLALVLTLVACGGKDQPAPEVEDGEEVEASDLKIGMVTDEGGVNDESFNQSAWEGLQRVQEELGITTKYQESKQEADFVQNFETLLDAEFDLMWGVGYKLSGATYDAAINNPDRKYGIVDFSYEGNDDFPKGTPENVVGVIFHDEQSSFLAGYVAGHTTETNKVGFVGGQKGVVIGKFENGYNAGVKYAAKELGKEIEVLNQYADSFGDAAKGKAIASSMFQKGADIVFHAAGGVGNGVIEAAKEADKWAIGVDRDQNDLAPDHVLTSVIKRVDVAVYNVAKDLKDGKFEGGKTLLYGLEHDGAVGLAATSDKNVKPEILEKVKVIEEKIVAGEIVPPIDAENYEKFIAELK